MAMKNENTVREIYSTDIEYWLTSNGLLLLESWARDGYTISDIANRVGIVRQTLERWMNKEPEIKLAINTGRELVDYKVENALLKAALGYKTTEVKITTTIRNGRTINTVKETVNKEFTPNVGACQTWLYNRRPDKWKNMNSKNNMLDNLDEDTNICITVQRADMASKGSASQTFEEPDTDWTTDVNQSVCISKGNKSDAGDTQLPDNTDSKKNSTSKSVSKGVHSSGTCSTVHSAHDDVAVDLDAWPDDWTDDEG